MMRKKRLLSIKDLVAEYGITDWFWRTQVWDKHLPYIQVGRKMFIDRDDVESFLEHNKTIG